MYILMIMFMLFFLISIILLLINLLISSKKNIDREKNSPYECGFDPFTSARLPFSIQFYMISIIFLIFDVEVIIFLPMISSFLTNKFISWSITSWFFIFILLLGLYTEWYEGALMWLK